MKRKKESVFAKIEREQKELDELLKHAGLCFKTYPPPSVPNSKLKKWTPLDWFKYIKNA
jgi:hypothetical protein